MANVSSINIEKAGRGSRHPLFHNCRVGWQPDNVYGEYSHLNSISEGLETAMEKLNKMAKERMEAFTKTTGRRFIATTWHRHAVVNLKPGHTLEDLKRVGDVIRSVLGFTPYHFSIHKDEGHYENGNFERNEHGHILLCCLDKNGINLGSKVTKLMLKTLQTKVSEVLGMQRGEIDSPRRHMSPFMYHEMIKRNGGMNPKQVLEMKADVDELKEVAKIKDLKEFNRQIRSKMKELAMFKKADYDFLTNIDSFFREMIKRKDLEINTLKEANAYLLTEMQDGFNLSMKRRWEIVIEKINKLKEYSAIIETKDKEINEKNEMISKLENEIGGLKIQNTSLVTQKDSLIKEYKEEKVQLETRIAELNDKNEKLQEKAKTKTEAILDTEVAEMEDCIEYLSNEDSAYYSYEKNLMSILKRFTPKPILKLIDVLFKKVNKQQEIIEKQQDTILQLMDSNEMKRKSIDLSNF